MNTQISERCIKIVSNVTKKDIKWLMLNVNTPFSDYLNQFDANDILMDLEEEFSISISDYEASELINLKSMIIFVTKKIRNSNKYFYRRNPLLSNI